MPLSDRKNGPLINQPNPDISAKPTQFCLNLTMPFFEAAFEAASKRLALGGHDTAGFADTLNYWFQKLDMASTNLGQTVEGIPLPMEFFAALTFLALTPESPFFMQSELPPGLDLELGAVLERAKTPEVLQLIELVGEVGGPLKAGTV